MSAELDNHAWRVGRIAMAAAQLEAEVASLVHVAKTGNWDNSDDWLKYAESTPRLRKDFEKALADYPEVLGDEDQKAHLARLNNLIDRRNQIVHSPVLASLFEIVDGVTRAREEPFEPRMFHAKSKTIRPLPDEEEIAELEKDLQEFTRTIHILSMHYAAEYERRNPSSD